MVEKLLLEDGSVGRVSFKFERLRNICYWCGSLTHGDKDCDLWLDSEGTLYVEDRQYGAWMRASLFSPAKKATVIVPGFYANRSTSQKQTPGGSGKPVKVQKPPKNKHLWLPLYIR